MHLYIYIKVNRGFGSPGGAQAPFPMGVPGRTGGPAALPDRPRQLSDRSTALRDAQDCSQDGLRWPPKTCQEGSKTPKMAPRRTKWAPKTPQESSKMPPKSAPRGQNR